MKAETTVFGPHNGRTELPFTEVENTMWGADFGEKSVVCFQWAIDYRTSECCREDLPIRG